MRTQPRAQLVRENSLRDQRLEDELIIPARRVLSHDSADVFVKSHGAGDVSSGAVVDPAALQMVLGVLPCS